MKKYLIAGGAGFIGSHLAERMISDGNSVTIVDNLSSGSTDNISDILDEVEFINEDICVFDSDEKYDGVFHLASIANPSEYANASFETLSSASFGTKRLLDIAKRSGARFYYFSSSEIYGHQMEHTNQPLSETSYSHVGLLHQRSPYYVSKMFSEEYVKSYSEKYDLEYAIIRPFNIYGTKMDSKTHYGRVVINFVNWAACGKPLVINGDGKQTRSFCYIDDFIEALMLVANADILRYNVLNIGNPDAVSIFELAKLISSISAVELPILYAERIPHEPRFRQPDITQIRDMTGWSPQTTLKDGLLSVLKWVMERGDIQ